METEGIEDARYSVVWRKHLHRLGGPSLEGMIQSVCSGTTKLMSVEL